MALPSGMVWEISSTGGSVYNGAGFTDLNPGTSVDYSQQDAAQLTAGDYATSGAGIAVLTSATGGFTAAMEGNVICLRSGSNFVTGHYQIVTYTNNNTVTLDRSPTPSGAGSGGIGNVGGRKMKFWDAWLGELNDGHIIWVKGSGTLTQTEDVDATAVAGTQHIRISIIGFNTTRGDAPTGTNRPLVACGGYSFTFGAYWDIENLRVTGTGLSVLNVTTDCQVRNVYAYNSSGTAGREAFDANGVDSQFIDCEGVSTNGSAFLIDADGMAIWCYAHDSADGFQSNGSQVNYHHCIADTCTGYGFGVYSGGGCINCTAYNCDRGFTGGTSRGGFWIYNCIIDSCATYGIVAFTPVDYNIDYNNYSSNGTDVTGVAKGPNATADAPAFTNAAGGDFTTGVAVQDNGLGIRLGIG